MRKLTKFMAAAAGAVLLTVMVGLSAPVVGAADNVQTSAKDVQTLRGAEVNELGVRPEIHGVEEGRPFARAYRQQPPLIPHRIDKYEIDLKTNQCMSCHDWPFNTKFNAPKVSETHYVDRQGNRLDDVARTRWFCTQCHVPQTDAPELVDNTFTPVR